MDFSKIKVIAMDLDGTLTNDDKIITPRTLKALMLAQQKGIRLVLASGRPPFGMLPLAKQLQMERYNGIVLAYNGGHIEECATSKVLVETKLDERLLPAIYEFQQKSDFALMTYYKDCIYTEKSSDQYVQISARNNKMKVVKLNNFVTDTPRPLNKCLMVGNPEMQPHWESEMQNAFSGQLNIMHSTPYFIEILPLGIDKGIALHGMMLQLGLSTDNLMTFGDSFNDIGMIKCAGIGVAMGNAENKVKECADIVAQSNNDDGIGIIVEQMCTEIN